MERLSGLDAGMLYSESTTVPLHVCSVMELDPSRKITFWGFVPWWSFYVAGAMVMVTIPIFVARGVADRAGHALEESGRALLNRLGDLFLESNPNRSIGYFLKAVQWLMAM